MQLVALVLPLIALQSGGKLEIKDVKVGKGQAAAAGDYVVVDYTGTLLNGKVFDSSKKEGREPFGVILGIGQVIKGWDQGLVGMKVGGTRNLTIPASMAYGDQAQGDIPANSTLKFTVELKKIERVKVSVLKKGSGAPAKPGDTVNVHYKGMLTDGKQFDTSYGRAPFPVTLGVSRVVPGFTMGLLGIRKGEKRKVTIPSTLGYGDRGAGGVIPPNATLVFELEALEISR
jgi:FKBP-type peptidyl-prolyl cis-trans isomerase